MFFEFGVTQLHSSIEVFGFYSSRDRLSELNCLHQVRSLNFVFTDRNDRGGSGWCSVEDSIDCFDTLHSRQPPIVEASLTATLCMAEDRNTSVELDPVGQKIFDLVCCDFGEVHIVRALGDDNYGSSLSSASMLLHDVAHLVLPTDSRWFLRYKQVVCTGCDRGH